MISLVDENSYVQTVVLKDQLRNSSASNTFNDSLFSMRLKTIHDYIHSINYALNINKKGFLYFFFFSFSFIIYKEKSMKIKCPRLPSSVSTRKIDGRRIPRKVSFSVVVTPLLDISFV